MAYKLNLSSHVKLFAIPCAHSGLSFMICTNCSLLFKYTTFPPWLQHPTCPPKGHLIILKNTVQFSPPWEYFPDLLCLGVLFTVLSVLCTCPQSSTDIPLYSIYSLTCPSSLPDLQCTQGKTAHIFFFFFFSHFQSLHPLHLTWF